MKMNPTFILILHQNKGIIFTSYLRIFEKRKKLVLYLTFSSCVNVVDYSCKFILFAHPLKSQKRKMLDYYQGEDAFQSYTSCQ